VYHFLRALAVFAFTIVFPTIDNAADWKPVGYQSTYVDIASIRTDHFSTQQGGFFTMQPYKVAWMKFTLQDGDVLAETVFNCRGAFAVMQQIVVNETPTSRFRSFNDTQRFRQIDIGPQPSTIVPDSAQEAAQKLVCK